MINIFKELRSAPQIGQTAARVALTAVIAVLMGAQPAPAQQSSMAIAAVVNEDIITIYDVQTRLGMFIATSGLENTPDVQRRLVPQVIQGLIEERLKLQEARRLDIETSEPEVRGAVDMIEAQNGMEPGAFRQMFRERGIDMGTLYSQIEADVAWVKVVRQELSRDVTVPPEEVKNVIARLKANQGKPEHLLAEIFLPVSAPNLEGDVQQLATRLVEQVRSGTPFPALAQQFSQSPTAAVGGDLGWVLEGDLEDELDRAVARLEPNEVTDPVRTVAGYHIMALRGRREAGEPDPLMAIVTLSQIYLPTIGGRSLAPDRIAQLTNDISTQIGNCDQMNQWAKQVGGPGSGPIEPLRVGSLPAKVREAVENLPVERVSPPVEVTGARLFVMVCSRIEDTGIPSEEEVLAKLENDKLENIARQRLRDLRRQALIDIRI